MNRHLSSEEFAARIMSEENLGVEDHLRGCPSCSAELASMQASLKDLRGAVCRWSDEQLGPDYGTIRRVKAAPYRAFVAKASFALALVIACVCLRFSLQSTAPRQNIVAESTISDAEILTNVDRQLANTLPASMAPLAQPLSYTSGSVQ